jgi:hypothetical protein
MQKHFLWLVVVVMLAGCVTTPPETATVTKLAVPPTEPEVTAPRTVEHAAVGAKVTVSSTHKEHRGEGDPSALVDGNLATRWSSDYTEPQKVVIDLGKEVSIGDLRLHWETAAATKYNIEVSSDGEEWEQVAEQTGDTGPRIDTIEMEGTPARFIKLDLLTRVNSKWGFSLYEIEAIGAE